MAQAAPIVQFAVAERPRERMLTAGPACLTDAELLALVLRTGNATADAVTLAHELLDRFGGVLGVLSSTAESLLEVPGLGGAKVAALLGIRELLERAEMAKMKNAPVVSSSDEVRRYLGMHLAGEQREVFGALLLDTRHRVLGVEDIFLGSIDRTMVYPREVAKCCLRYNAAAVVLYHNHPSGSAEPSASDRELTERLNSVLGELDVRLLDHVVVAGLRKVSMAERGML